MQRTACGDARCKINTNYAQAIAKNFNEKTVQVVGNIKTDKCMAKHVHITQCWMTNVCLFIFVFVPCMLTKEIYRACSKVHFMIIIKTFAVV